MLSVTLLLLFNVSYLQASNLIDAQANLVSAQEVDLELVNEKEFKALPNEYRLLNEKQGTIETLVYNVANRRGGTDVKRLHVYLPHGYYDEKNDTKYNVLYLMHGGSENEDLLFGGPGQNRELKKIIDNMIEFGDIDPLIVVTPTFYGGKNEAGLFHEELISDVLPLVETKYRTYAGSGDLDIAYNNMLPQIEVLKELTDSFIYSGDLSKGNFYFMVAKGGVHRWNWVNQYIYGILPDLFHN